MKRDPKVCPLCGHIYPYDYMYDRCKYCGGALWRKGPCELCGKDESTWKQVNLGAAGAALLCDECTTNLVRCMSPNMVFVHNKQTLLESWQRNISLQRPSVLTEEEWYQTCSYFNGCAICGQPEIDVRQPFVSNKNNGSYSKWNIVPICDRCTFWLRNKGIDNPFNVFSSPLKAQALPMIAKRYEHAMGNIIYYLYHQFENPVDKYIWEFQGPAWNYVRTYREREKYERSNEYDE